MGVQVSPFIIGFKATLGVLFALFCVWLVPVVVVGVLVLKGAL